MYKLSKLLTTIALCGLFTFTNTSGIEEKMPTPKSAVSFNTFEKGIWYHFDTYYNLLLDETLSFNGNIGVFDFVNDDYSSCSSIAFTPSSFIYTRVSGSSITLSYSTIYNLDDSFALCFGVSTPVPSVLSTFFYVDNSTPFPFVNLTYNIDLISTKFQPLIYLGYDIFDDFFVQYGGASDPSSYEVLQFFAGSFNSGGSRFVGMKAYYHRYNGLAYTIDGTTSKVVPLDTHGHGLWACTRVSYIRPDLTELTALKMGSFYVGDTALSSTLVFNEKKYASIQLLSYSTDIGMIPSNGALNSFEALLMRPESVDHGFTDNGNVFVNAFALLSLVYTSLAGFLSFQIFPGLTLGLFLLIPLVVTIIVLIFKVVN